VVEHMSDEIIVMNRGKIVERGTPAQVCGSPQHDYTRKLLAAVPKL
jgi:peptide/nickel transport system ATP-binding protein